MWHQDDKDSYTIESSMMQNGNCPKCNLPITKTHLTKTDTDAAGEDVYGWRYYHPCGASLLIIND